MDIEKFLIDEVTKSPDYVGHPTDRYYYSEKDMVTFAEKYHQAKLKLLDIADVVGQSEQLPTDIEIGKMVSDLAKIADDEM